MNEQQLAAVKQAVEALMVFRYAPPAQRPLVIKAIADLEQVIAQDALHKMAEESRTSGLRLDDWDKIGCVNHDCDKCKAVQEPIGYFTVNGYDMWEQIDDTGGKPLYEHAAAQKPWVGLTDEEMLAVVHYSQLDNARAIEAKLKEKNT